MSFLSDVPHSPRTKNLCLFVMTTSLTMYLITTPLTANVLPLRLFECRQHLKFCFGPISSTRVTGQISSHSILPIPRAISTHTFSTLNLKSFQLHNPPRLKKCHHHSHSRLLSTSFTQVSDTPTVFVHPSVFSLDTRP